MRSLGELVDGVAREGKFSGVVRVDRGSDTELAAAYGLANRAAGVSFRTVHDPDTPLTYTVISNTSDGAWPIARALAECLG
jgi:hypothetical protein